MAPSLMTAVYAAPTRRQEYFIEVNLFSMLQGYETMTWQQAQLKASH